MAEKIPEKQEKKQGKRKLSPEAAKYTWKPGQSGNPAGRPPKAVCLTDTMRAYLDGTIDTQGGQITRAEALVRAVYGNAMKGDVAAQKLMINYIDGMPVQKIEQTNITPIDKIEIIRPPKVNEITSPS